MYFSSAYPGSGFFVYYKLRRGNLDNKSAFMFSGQGSQYFHMGRQLFEQDIIFRKWMLLLDKTATQILGESVLEKIYDTYKVVHDDFNQTIYTHPAIFMVEYALARMLMEKGVIPDLVVGSSLGEFVAAAVAGVSDPETMLEIVIMQARIIDSKCPPGGMMAVLATPEWYQRLSIFQLKSEIAAVNSNTHFVVSGTKEGLQEIAHELKRHELLYHILPISHGFHSSMIDLAKQEITSSLSQNAFCSPNISWVSGLNGEFLGKPEPNYFWRVARESMRFEHTAKVLKENGIKNYIDLSPSGTLASFMKYYIDKNKNDVNIYSLLSPYNNGDQVIQSVINLHGSKIHQPLTNQASEGSRELVDVYLFPGQGSQHVGMGKDLFEEFSEITMRANDILGYSIQELCLYDTKKQLSQTQYTQPALYVVNALMHMKKVKEGGDPGLLAGHSLGEYNALLAAGAFDFETGLRMVQKRGELMGKAYNGGMAAVIGMGSSEIERVLQQNGLEIDIANENAPSQVVISGKKQDILNAEDIFGQAGARYVPLNVSGAFHSRFMQEASREFASFIAAFSFSELNIPVISNINARPYRFEDIANNLVKQITSPVKWTETMMYILTNENSRVLEVGPGNVLERLVLKNKEEIKQDTLMTFKQTLLHEKKNIQNSQVSKPTHDQGVRSDVRIPARKNYDSEIIQEHLGSKTFLNRYGVEFAYVAGGMCNGISSVKLVEKLSKAGILSFLGTNGLSFELIRKNLLELKNKLSFNHPYGVNLSYRSHEIGQVNFESDLVDLFIEQKMTVLEASGYLSITLPLVKFRLKGIRRGRDGEVVPISKIMAKVSRPEMADLFLSPPPEEMVNRLLGMGEITEEEARLSQLITMADDLCVMTDSAEVTDRIPTHALLPTIIKLKNEYVQRYPYVRFVNIGSGGSIGTPEAAAAAFFLGADFILTGSINQCSVEAGTSDEVKEMLAGVNVQDTEFVPAARLFEIGGGRAQVVKKGVLFPTRANKLYEWYRQHRNLEEMDSDSIKKLEDKYFGCSLEQAIQECRNGLSGELLIKFDENPQYRMFVLFKSYLSQATEYAVRGDSQQRVNYQIFCSSALGSFNEWVRGTDLENWRNRHVDRIAVHLMRETDNYYKRRSTSFVKAEILV